MSMAPTSDTSVEVSALASMLLMVTSVGLVRSTETLPWVEPLSSHPRAKVKEGSCRSSLRHEDLREGSAPEALLFDDIQLQVLFQVGEWAVPRPDRNRDRRQLVFVDEAQAGHRLSEVGAAVDE